jgi:hypothetical protein
MWFLTTLVLCRLHGMLESWNNGQKRITSVVCIWLRIGPNAQQGWLQYGSEYEGPGEV